MDFLNQDEQFKSYVAEKLRKKYDLKHFSDDDVLQTMKNDTAPEFTDKEYALTLMHEHLPSYHPDAVTLGSVARGVAGAAGGIVKGLAEGVASVPLVAQEALTGRALGRSLDTVTNETPTVSQMRAKGYSDEQIHNVIAGQVATEQSIIGDVEQTSQDIKHTASAGIGLASSVIPAGEAALALKSLGPLVAGAGAGTAGGAVQGGTQAALEGQSLGDIARATGIGAATGLVAGGVGGGVAKALPRTAAPVAPSPVENVPGTLKPSTTLPSQGGAVEVKAPAAGVTPHAEGAPAVEQPFKPTSRVDQLAPEHRVVAAKIETSPGYAAKLDELGGGRRITNAETWHKALQSEPMTVEELASWEAGKPVAEVDVARAKILRQNSWDSLQNALESGDANAIQGASDKIASVEAGFNALTATPGRALQLEGAPMPGQTAEAVTYMKALATKVKELQEAKVPADQWNAKIDEMKAKLALDPKNADPFVRRMVDRAESWATAAKLTSPVTHLINTVSNTVTFAQRGVERLVAARVLRAVGKVGEAEAYERNAFGSIQGFKDAWRKAGEVFAHGEDMGKSEFVRETKLPLKAHYVFRALAAADAFWKTAIHDSEVATRAYAQAKSEGITGDAFSQRVAGLMEDPPVAWTKAASEAAKEYTFQNDPDRLLRAMQSIQNVPGMRLVIPFLKTPYNILKFHLRRSVVGVLSPRNIRDWRLGGVARAEAVGRMGTGLALTGVALALYNSNEVTGAYPKSAKERARWEAEGKKPWSIRVGNRWLAYNRVSPLGMYLTDVAAVGEAIKEGRSKDAEPIYNRLIRQFIKGNFDMPFLQGMSALIDALEDPERSFAKFGRLIATGFLPSVLRDVRQQLDPARRKPTSLKEALEEVMPGFSTKVQPRIDVLGRVQGLDPNHLARATKMLAPETDTPELKELRRLGWMPSVPQTSFEKKGVLIPLANSGEAETPNGRVSKVELSGRMKTLFLNDEGLATAQAIRAVMATPGYAEVSDERKKYLLNRRIEKARELYRNQYKRAVGISPKGLDMPELARESENWWKAREGAGIVTEPIMVSPEGVVRKADAMDAFVTMAAKKTGEKPAALKARMDRLEPEQFAAYVQSFEPEPTLPSQGVPSPELGPPTQLAGTKQQGEVPVPMTPPWEVTRSISTRPEVGQSVRQLEDELKKSQAEHRLLKSADSAAKVRLAAKKLKHAKSNE